MRKLRRLLWSRGPARRSHQPWQLQSSACAAPTQHSAPCGPSLDRVLSSMWGVAGDGDVQSAMFGPGSIEQ